LNVLMDGASLTDSGMEFQMLGDEWQKACWPIMRLAWGTVKAHTAYIYQLPYCGSSTELQKPTQLIGRMILGHMILVIHSKCNDCKKGWNKHECSVDQEL